MTTQELNEMSVWAVMPTIDLASMTKVKLMNRVDTKFIAHDSQLESLLRQAAGEYAVQIVAGSPISRYDTLYYDTSAVSLYMMHHNRRLCRQKVRTRTYLDSSDLTFLEIKNKNNKGRTKKKRIEIGRDDFFNFSGNDTAADFETGLGYFRPEQLQAHVRTMFDRITLVNSAHTERLTIDTNLRFENLATGRTTSLPHLMIIELKQDGTCFSHIRQLLLEMRIKPERVSKYCIGTVLTDPSIKANRFKEKLRRIFQLIGEPEQFNQL